MSSVSVSKHDVNRRFVGSVGFLAPSMTMREKRISRTSRECSASCMAVHSTSVKKPSTERKSCILFLSLRSFFSFVSAPFFVAAVSDSTTADKSRAVNPTPVAVVIKSDAACAPSEDVVGLLVDSLIAAAWIAEMLAFVEESGALAISIFVAPNLARKSLSRSSLSAMGPRRSKRRAPPKTGRGARRKQRVRALVPKRLGSARARLEDSAMRLSGQRHALVRVCARFEYERTVL